LLGAVVRATATEKRRVVVDGGHGRASAVGEALVALKVLSPKVVGTPDTLRRFQREVKAAARLMHPNRDFVQRTGPDR
jgi:serine/threonine protein kinase